MKRRTFKNEIKNIFLKVKKMYLHPGLLIKPKAPQKLQQMLFSRKSFKKI